MRKFVPYFGVAVILTILFGTVYAAVQQAQRSGANYPQIQLAEDAAASLNQQGTPLEQASGEVDIAASLAPFTIVYDKSGKPIASSARLHGTIPVAPIGVLKAANGKPYHAVTWQLAPSVRIAAVTVAANNYYVLSGRSLRQVELNEGKTLQIAATGWAAAIVVLALTCFTQTKLAKPAGKKRG